MEESMRKRLEITQARLTQIEKELSEESIAEDLPKLTKLTKERAYLEPIVCKFDEYLKSEKNYQDSFALEEMGDPEMTELAKEERKAAMNSMEALERELHLLLVPRDPNDDKNIIVEIRGAVGGDEANLFAGDLLHMYAKYAESQGWSLKLLDASLGAAGGYASVSFMIKGESVYSKMKFESGAHRVQRVPKTESQGRIHTSTATVLVMPEAEEVDVKINPADLKIDTYHSQGAGGPKRQQNGIGGPNHSPSDRPCCCLPNRESPIAEQRNCHANDPGQSRCLFPRERRFQTRPRTQTEGRDWRAVGENPHL